MPQPYNPKSVGQVTSAFAGIRTACSVVCWQYRRLGRLQGGHIIDVLWTQNLVTRVVDR